MAGLAALLEIPAVVVEEGPLRNGHTDPDILERLPAATPTVVKPTFGLAAHPEAVDAIRATGRGTAVVAGFETDVCVAQSAIGLLELGFRAVVLEDAIYTNSALEHERGIAGMTSAGVGRTHRRGLPLEGLHRGARGPRDSPQGAALATPP